MVTLATLYNDFKTLIKQNFYDKDEVDDALSDKQDSLVSGTNIKTVNGNSLLGSGNISISGSGTVDSSLSTTSTNPVQNKVINTALTNKVDKSDGANQMTDSNAYTSLGTSANSTQKTINNAIDTEINSINNSITNITSTSSVTVTPANVSNANDIVITRIGNLVKLWWIDNSVTVTSSTIGSYKLLGTLPEEYRPPSQVWFTQAYSLNMERGYKTSLCITNSGQMQLYCWWTGTNQATPCAFTGIYSLI